jgi:hypothetical protein
MDYVTLRCGENPMRFAPSYSVFLFGLEKVLLAYFVGQRTPVYYFQGLLPFIDHFR